MFYAPNVSESADCGVCCFWLTPNSLGNRTNKESTNKVDDAPSTLKQTHACKISETMLAVALLYYLNAYMWQG